MFGLDLDEIGDADKEIYRTCGEIYDKIQKCLDISRAKENGLAGFFEKASKQFVMIEHKFEDTLAENMSADVRQARLNRYLVKEHIKSLKSENERNK